MALSPEGLYSSREQRFRADVEASEARSKSISRARLAVFFAGVGCLGVAFTVNQAFGAWLFGTAVAAGGFLALVVAHQRLEDRLEQQRAMAEINREAGFRVRREWRSLPEVQVEPPPENHRYAADLDIFGHASLLQLLGGIGTPCGTETLRTWLLAPAALGTIAERQAAIDEMAPGVEFRQELVARACQAAVGRAGGQETGLARFLEWAEGKPWLVSRPWLVWLTRLLGASGVLLAGLHAVGGLHEPLWLAPALVNTVVWFLLVRRIEHSFGRAFSRDSAPGREARMFEVAEQGPFKADLILQLQDRIGGASRAMRQLQRLMELADIRFTTLVHFPINALTLWDFHILAAVERWQLARGSHVRDWFAAVGEIEALSSLAGLRHDNPGWAFPTFSADPCLEASGLGHPLLPERTRVVNQVKVGPPGTFLFVTGSNMSGKSTLLRAIGVNAVLAQAGGPVCATAMRVPPVIVTTSMRVQDSLEEGVSYFLAALRRLRQILEDARQAQVPGGVLLYLLDEILQGTNTAERQIAVRTVLSQFLAAPAIGAVTSHDLNLADEEPLATAAVPVHFEEHFDGESMTFDYTLRPGVATSRNALKLMKMMGIAT